MFVAVESGAGIATVLFAEQEAALGAQCNTDEGQEEERT